VQSIQRIPIQSAPSPKSKLVFESCEIEEGKYHFINFVPAVFHMFSLKILGRTLLTLSDIETSGLSLTIGLPFGMVKGIKSDGLAVNCGKMWINFADEVKNFHNLKFRRDFGIGLGRRREIGWGRNQAKYGVPGFDKASV
jgi:hypothetical protein